MSNGTTLYTDGNADFTNGSAAIVGHSTLWTNLVNGDTMIAPDGKWYELTITDDTHITLDRNYTGSTASAQLTTIFKNSTARDSVRTATKQLSSVSATYGSLLTATGPNQTLKLNKATSADSAGITFRHFADAQDTFQVGSFGDDNYSIKYQLASVWTKAFDLNSTTGAVSLMSQFLLGGTIAPPQITVDTGDYSPTGLAQASIILINSDATRALNGLAGGASGRVMAIINNGTQQINLVSGSPGSFVAANRFVFTADIALLPNSGVLLIYDSTASRWRNVSSGGSSGGTAGWSPVFGVYTDTFRHVLQIIDWTGGAGVKPATGSFIGASGLVSTPAAAVDITGFSTSAQACTLLASVNPNFVQLHLAATADDTILTTAGIRGHLEVVASQSIGISQGPNTGGGTAIVGVALQDRLGSAQPSFPCGIIGYGVISSAGAGNMVFGGFSRADLNASTGVCIGWETDTNNSVADATWPASSGLPATGAHGFGIQSVNIGQKKSSVAFRAVTSGQVSPTNPSGINAPWLVHFYADPPVAGTLYNILMDATATLSAATTALLRNTGQGSNVHLTLQTMGAQVPANIVLQHLNSSGGVSFSVAQNGSTVLNANANTSLATVGAPNLFIAAVDGNGDVVELSSFGSVQNSLLFLAAAGTGASPSALATNGLIATIGARPFVGSGPGGYATSSSGRISFTYTDNGAAGHWGTSVSINTTPNGSSTPATAATFQPSGGLSIGTTTDPGLGGIYVSGNGIFAGSLTVNNVINVNGYQVINTSPAGAATAYNSFVDSAGNGALICGGGGSAPDHSNYYRNTLHNFAGIGGGFYSHFMNSSGLYLHSSTAIGAGGTTDLGIRFSSSNHFGIFYGSGVPTLTAAQGSLYLRSDGAINARLYINTNGTTGWTAFNTLT